MTIYVKLFVISLTITACMETPEISVPQESITREKILKNQTEAKNAQEAYLKLQKNRK